MQTGHISNIELLHNPIFADRLVNFWKNLLWDFFTNSIRYFQERKDIQYHELNIIEEYLGPKVGFYFAFVRFYTAWLVFPALIGAVLTILIRVSRTTFSIGLIPYSFICTLWLILFYVKWKRKSAELSMNWNTFNTKNKTERDSYVGIKYYDKNTNKINSKKVVNKLFYLQLLHILVFLVFMSICICVFIFLKIYEVNNPTNGIFLLTGVVNGLAVIILDFIYKYIIRIFVEIENHKHDKYFDTSLATKRLFFSIVNSNISLMWTLYYDKNFDSLFFQIIGQILIKILSVMFFSVYEIIKYKVAKTYFFIFS